MALALSGCADRTSATPGHDAAPADAVGQDLAAEIAQVAPDAVIEAAHENDGSVDGPGEDVPSSPDAGVPDAPPSVDAVEADASCFTESSTCLSATVSRVCDVQEHATRDVVCSLGCLAEGPRAGACREVVPSNGFAGLTCGDDRVSLVSLDIQENAELDPDHGSYSTVTSTILAAPAFVVAYQGGSAPPVGIFHLAHLIIHEGQTLTIRRGAENGVVFLIDGDVEIDGTLDVGAKGNASGAGAVALGAGSSSTTAAGHGGGGFGTLGSAGGASDAFVGGAAGSVYGIPTLVPLFGGSPGGGLGPFAGGGGGALQISACGKVRIGPHGVIRASGGGGQAAGAVTAAGAGGGSGGAVLIEGRMVSIEGTIAANGGGGAGASMQDAPGTSGGDGTITAETSATGGMNASGGNAGAGACAALTASTAEATGATPAGGGGGGLGRIALSTMDSAGGGAPISLTGISTPIPTLTSWPTR